MNINDNDDISRDDSTDKSDGKVEGDYEVGYRKPPKQSQFKKGQSGNPKGRPKAARNLKTELNEELFETVSFNENGQPKKTTKLRAIFKSLVAKAVKGDTRAAIQLAELCRKLNPEPVDSEEEDDFTSDEEDLLNWELDRLLEIRQSEKADLS